MTDRLSFDSAPDRELGDLLREHLTGPAPEAFLARLAGGLARAPRPRDTQWEVLARWARPRVLAVAVAAAFLLGVSLWRHLTDRDRTGVGAALPVAAVEARDGEAQDVVWQAVMEER